MPLRHLRRTVMYVGLLVRSDKLRLTVLEKGQLLWKILHSSLIGTDILNRHKCLGQQCLLLILLTG